MRAGVIVAVGVCLALAGCSLFGEGGETPKPQPPASTTQSSAPNTPAPPARSSTAPTTAPGTATAPASPSSGAPSAKTPANAGPPAKSPPKQASAPPPKPVPPATASAQSPKPAGGAGTPAPAAAPAPAAPALDLTALEQRLRDTKAIGVFTKLSLKNQVDDLLAQFKAFHNKQAKLSQSDLRQRFDLLLLKVLSLLQDNDPSLAAAINSSREALWGILMDPVKFSKLS